MFGDSLWIAAGAILGANLRYGVSRAASRYISASVPYGTLLVNVTGSLLLGAFLTWSSERVLADPRWRPLVAIGFCGSYTTFSSYSFETFNLWEQGHYQLAALNFVVNNVLCLVAVLVGAMLARAAST